MDGNSYTYGDHVKAPENQDAWSQWSALEAARSKLLEQAEQA